ncbi:BspA family leucine-rich repeat surface protein [Aquiflexum gelatinilyticum]|uniref:BspA family leucine-rich repeat surface protein n=1 Tax=Aquiflexum gelatinilyticum TaxID=2961943 RepID=UPI0021675230|nr:BspA family leucine-rich repeat surface protein [Aquiflexum gelatinilyticum]MCS4436609.1 BspA family leucine-rich repeat surface protein [Aquiflexum gelatinilyticum]
MKKTVNLFSLLLSFTMVCLLSCQQEDSDLPILEGNVRFGGISLEFAPMGTEGSRLAAASPWLHIFPNSAKIVFINKVTDEEYILEYNPNDFSKPYTISLPFGAYEFYTKVGAGIFSDFLPFEAKGGFILNSQSQEISLVGKTDYGLISVKNEFLEEATVSEGNIEANLTICDNGTHYYKYVKGGTSTTLKIIESTFGGTITKKISVGANVHYNFVLKRGEGTANIIDLSIDPFELVDEEIIIGSSVFFEENGTIKCPQASPGDKGEVNGKTYEAVDRALLIQRRDGGADLTCLCTSLVIDMSNMLQGSEFGIKGIVSFWDVTNVTNMEGMFMWNDSFNQPLEKWDVSNVTNMAGMFRGTESFNQNIGIWDVSNVTTMRGMFALYSNPGPIGDWDVSNVTDMRGMFSETTFNHPIGNWDVSNVTTMAGMFRRNNSFNQPIGNWNVSKVTDMSQMFELSGRFNQPIGVWDVGGVNNMNSMFSMADSFNQPLENWNVENVTTMVAMFSNTNFNQPIGDWDIRNVTQISGMFTSAKKFNQPIGNWDVSKVQSMVDLFGDAKSFNQNLSEWCVENILIEPSGFSIESPLIEEYKPIWGTCPD